MKAKIWANALLSDGKILFWWTGRDKADVNAFYKDFFYARIDMYEYRKKHRVECKSIGFTFDDDDSTESTKLNNMCFEDFAKSFYRLFEISPDSRGSKPY